MRPLLLLFPLYRAGSLSAKGMTKVTGRVVKAGVKDGSLQLWEGHPEHPLDREGGHGKEPRDGIEGDKGSKCQRPD